MPAALTVRPVRRLVVPLAALCAGAGFASAGVPSAAVPVDPAGVVRAAVEPVSHAPIVQATPAAQRRPEPSGRGVPAAPEAMPAIAVASVRPPDRLAAATPRPDGFVVVPLRDAQLTVRRLPLRPDDGNPAAADPRDEPVSGPTQAILVLAGLIGWIAARRSR